MWAKVMLQCKACLQCSKRMRKLFIEYTVLESHFKVHRENSHHKALPAAAAEITT